MEPPESFDRLRKADRLFAEALELNRDARESFVRERCAGDRGLAESVLNLLARYEQLGSFLEAPANERPPASRLQKDALLCGRFRIVRHIADGGMGEVYQAEDIVLGDEVALKMVRSNWRKDRAMVEHFHQEIRLARRIAHPNVCRIFDLFEHPAEDGENLLFFTMEYLAGETLAARLAAQGVLPEDEVRSIIRQAAEGLDGAHRADVVHGDLKPANIHLTPKRVVITDFGLARRFGQAFGEDGLIAGTPEYMAPEQFQGAVLTPAADIYALGIVLYEMLAGSRPWPSESLIRAAVRRFTEKPPRLSGTSPKLGRHWDSVIVRALSRLPSERYASGAALVKDLDSLHSSVMTLLHFDKPVSRRGVVGGLITAAAVSSFAGWLRFHNRSPEIPNAPLVMLTPIADAPDKQKAKALDLFLAGQLQNSAHLQLLPAERIGAARKRMGTDASDTTPMKRIEAREVAMREGAALLITSRCGTTLTNRSVLEIEVELLGRSPSSPAHSWNYSCSLEDTAASVAGKAAYWVRNEVLRESREDLAVARPAPEELTTSSWKALQEYLAAQDAWAASLGRGSGKNPLVTSSPFSAARAHLEAALVADPEFALAAGRLADLLLAAGQSDDAMAAHARADGLLAKKNLTDRESYRMRGMFALDTGQNEAAEQIFYRYSLEFPYDSLPTYYRASAIARLGNRAKALDLHSRIVDQEPRSYAFRMGRAITLIGLHQLDKAQADCDLGRRIYSQDWTDQIDASIAFGLGDEAKLRQALDRMRNGSEEFQSKAFVFQACYQAERGDLSQAKRLLGEGLEFDRRTGRPLEELARKMRQLGEIALAEGNSKTAKQLCREALEFVVGQKTRMELGCVLARAGDPALAEKCLRPLPGSPMEQRWNEWGRWPVFAFRSRCLEAEIFAARGHFNKALDRVQKLNDPWGWTWPSCALRVAACSGALDLASRQAEALAKAPAHYWLYADHNEIGLFRNTREMLQKCGMSGRLGLRLPALT